MLTRNDPRPPRRPLARLSTRLDRMWRRVLWHRRPLAAACAALAAYVGVQAATAPPPPTTAVWVAAHDLPSGTVLRLDDLTRRAFTPASVPGGRLLGPGDVAGRTLATPVSAGMPLTPGAVVSGHWLAGRPGIRAVPVRLTDPAVVPLLRVGDRVSLVAADPQRPGAARELAADAVVLALPQPGSADAAGADPTSLPGRLVLMGVPDTLADAVVAASAQRFLTVVWSR